MGYGQSMIHRGPGPESTKSTGWTDELTDSLVSPTQSISTGQRQTFFASESMCNEK